MSAGEPKEETSSGLLSRVVKFVKNPNTNWSDLGPLEADRESSYSKQMLKEMIERKRRNDFVRKREFDMLRKMRRSEVIAGHDPGARPSFFQSSMPSKPDDRATTLKKIDEIEAQMSMQWWKTKHGDSAVRPGANTHFPMSSHVPPDIAGQPGATAASIAYLVTTPTPLTSIGNDLTVPDELRPMLESVTPEPALPLPPVQSMPVVPVVPAAVLPRPPAPSPMPMPSPASSPMPAVAAQPPVSEIGSGFSNSKTVAIDVEEFTHDPELEEASIRFANGDDDGAEAGLMEVLGPKGLRLNHEETWLTLFDLYRATGRQDRFETAAIDFAGRFGRSAPQWVSFPEQLGRLHAAPAAAPAAGTPLADWTCPQVLGTQTLATMAAALARAAQPWRLSWVKLNTIDEAAAEGLTRMFTQWAAQPLQLRFIGAENFEKVLKAATASGDKGVNQVWWKLRMEVLRVMHRPDEFEMVALDYCVTYEVSPPSWDSAQSEYKPLQADGSQVSGFAVVSDSHRDSLHTELNEFDDTQQAPNSQLPHVAMVELAGQITGDATEALAQLDAKFLGADTMVISCARLIRIDFSAAGNLLNWVSTRQSEGRHVQFTAVNRLVVAFFNVIGISEHAQVQARLD